MTNGNETRVYQIITRAGRYNLRWTPVSVFRLRVRTKRLLTALPVLALLYAPLSAQAYQSSYSPPSFNEFSSPAVTDLCLPLLKSLHTTSPNAVTNRTQRTAGTAAARLSVLSLAFGVRYALGPTEDTGTQQGLPDLETSGHAASVISAYRECHKEQVLKVLSNTAGQIQTSATGPRPQK